MPSLFKFLKIVIRAIIYIQVLTTIEKSVYRCTLKSVQNWFVAEETASGGTSPLTLTPMRGGGSHWLEHCILMAKFSNHYWN